MKTKTFKNRDFSYQFDNITLSDIINEKKEKTSYGKPTNLVSPKEDRKNLIDRMLELPPIIPARYVWHVTHLYCYEDLTTFSIASRGILREYCHYGSAVFAHNKLTNLSSFYPFNIDLNSFEERRPLNDLTPSGFLLGCGFWRIDNTIFKGKWYIDPNLKDGDHFGDGTEINYICTPEDIPPQALKYYEFDMESYLLNLPQLLQNRSCGLLQVAFLKPVNKVNQWIRRLERAA